jgi:phenylacetate-CoA ligase
VVAGAGIHHRLHRDHRQLLENTLITEGKLFPTIHRYFTEYLAWLKLDDTEVRQLRQDRLAAQLRHAATQVPAYRHMDPATPLAQWPFTSKADIRDRLADHCDDAIDPATSCLGHTSGTTGIPVRIVHDHDHLAHKYALALRRNQVDGFPLRRRILIPMRDGALPWLEFASPAHGNSIVAEFGSGGHDSTDNEVIRRACRFEPDIVYGHPSNCIMFAEALEEAGGQVRPRIVLTYGETLTDDQREQLEATFDAPVRDGYGMREFGTIAVQCENGSYHVESERLAVEVVDRQGNPVPLGEPGEIVITDLVNRAMPLIRYRTADTGRLSPDPCACGYPGDLLAGIEGRDLGSINFEDGSSVPVNAITRIIRRYPLRRFQIVQPATARIDVLIQARRRRVWPPAMTAQLAAEIEAYVERSAAVTVRPVEQDDFLRTASGKDSDYISLI